MEEQAENKVQDICNITNIDFHNNHILITLIHKSVYKTDRQTNIQISNESNGETKSRDSHDTNIIPKHDDDANTGQLNCVHRTTFIQINTLYSIQS